MHNSRAAARHRLQRPAATLLFAAGFASMSACGDTLRSAGPNPAVAESQAEQLFEAFKARFTQVEFGPRYDAVRVKLARSALVPSGMFADSSVWDARPSPTEHVVYVAGTLVDGHYRIETRATPLAPARPGDSRHIIALEQLGGPVYRWDTTVDMGIGGITAEGMSVLITSLLAAPEGRTERALREDYRGAFPRATAAFGHGMSIDSLHVTPGAANTTGVVMTIGFHPELMRPGYPALADYVDKYLGPAKYHFVLADRAGVVLFDVLGRDRAATLRYRVQQGRLTSLFGPPRAWPDTVQLTADLSLKVKVFTVGFHNLLTDFVISNAGHDRAWTVLAQHEPKWDLPFIAERLIRSPLHRPFEGAGAMFRLAVRDSAGAQTIFTRHARLDVQESTIMRFLGSLGSHAMSDIDARVESDEGRYWHDGFAALQADLRDHK